MTSNRIVRTDFFRNKVDGWLSLSGGRLGPTPPIPASFFAAFQPADGIGRAGTAGPPPPNAAGLAAANAAA